IKMPPAGKLPDHQNAKPKSWVEKGAGAPRDSPPLSRHAKRPPHHDGRKHWGLQPEKDHAPPKGKKQKGGQNQNDRIIHAKVEEKRIAPAAPASKPTLLRRATYDLTGLPPTPQEIEAFLSDDSKEAFAKVVDRLLASPQYGERWGRHWLDVARFADSTGMDED